MKITNKLTFCFDDEMFEIVLITTRWTKGWNSEMWVPDNKNADLVSYAMKEAFAKILYKSNLVPENVERCWKND